MIVLHATDPVTVYLSARARTRMAGAGELDFAGSSGIPKAIYKFDGDDRVTLCFAAGPDSPRPKEFKSDDDNNNSLNASGRERVSQLAWCGEGCFDSCRCVNSGVRHM